VIAGEWGGMTGTGAAEEGESERNAVPESGGAEGIGASSRHRCELRPTTGAWVSIWVRDLRYQRSSAFLRDGD